MYIIKSVLNSEYSKIFCYFCQYEIFYYSVTVKRNILLTYVCFAVYFHTLFIHRLFHTTELYRLLQRMSDTQYIGYIQLTLARSQCLHYSCRELGVVTYTDKQNNSEMDLQVFNNDRSLQSENFCGHFTSSSYIFNPRAGTDSSPCNIILKIYIYKGKCPKKLSNCNKQQWHTKKKMELNYFYDPKFKMLFYIATTQNMVQYTVSSYISYRNTGFFLLCCQKCQPHSASYFLY
jgi:hypothetical protein